MNILLTAFDPFGGASVNPAWEVVSRLKEDWGPHRLHKLLVPTVFGAAEELTNTEAARIGADAVICVGQAGGRFEVSFERVAVNLDDASIPDNQGNQPQDVPITPGGAPACFTNLPVKKMAEAVRMAGVPAAVSYTAGTFVCNHLFYRVMEEIAAHYPRRYGGFIHLPFLTSQTVFRSHTPSLSLETQILALETALTAFLSGETL